jgi:hypothetical protein
VGGHKSGGEAHNGDNPNKRRVTQMIVELGEKGLKRSYQESFPASTKCVHCGGEARPAFVAQELPVTGDEYVCDLHEDEGKGGYWPHDCIAVAVYLCKDCMEPTALCNQA